MTTPPRTTPHPHGIVLLLLAASLGLSADVAAQSLAEVARRQADHLSLVRVPARVYTNADLPAVPVAPPRPEASAVHDFAAPVGSETDDAPLGGPDVVVPPAPTLDDRGEDYWRQRALTIRRRVDRAANDVAALQARLRSIRTSPANDPAGEQSVTLGVLGDAQDDLRALNEEWLGFEAQAQLAKVPVAWLR